MNRPMNGAGCGTAWSQVANVSGTWPDANPPMGSVYLGVVVDEFGGLEELAERTGLSKSYLHDIEKGRKYPKVDKIDTLARGLGVEYDYLVSRRADRKLQPVVLVLKPSVVADRRFVG